MQPIAVDLFAGVGGMSLGFQQAGFNVACAVEIDPVHARYHSLNFPNTKVICRDIKNIYGDDIRELPTLKYQEITVVFGGSPCQGYSIGGKRNADDDRNNLVLDFVRVVLELQPRYFVFENVKGILSGYGKHILDEMISKFNYFGYEVLPYKVLNAKDFGVPQNRSRLIMIGYRNDCEAPTYPQPISKRLVTVWDAIGDLPEASEYPILFERDYIFDDYGVPSDYARSLKSFKYRMNNAKLTRHSEKTIARFSVTSQGARESISRFYKLDPHGLCPTLRAGTGSDKGNHTAPRPIHPFIPRVITVREAARLHSFPDSFKFHPSCMWGMRQIGNAVCPLMAKAIAQSIPH